MRLKGGVGVVRCLKAEGINWVATFPASTVNEVLAEEGVRHVMARDERTAVAIADGFSRVSDGKRFGVATCIGGINAAGIQYAYGALAQAFEDSSPLLCLTGGVNADEWQLSRYDTQRGLESVTKWTAYINTAERVPEYMRRAFTYLKTGHPAPILLLIPRDVVQQEYDDATKGYSPVKGWKAAGDPRDVEVTVRALLAAKNPLIYAGQGVFHADACAELRAFVELVQMPVMATLLGKSVFPETHPLYLGVRGGPVTHFLEGADLIFGIGTSLNKGRFSHVIPNAHQKTILQTAIDEYDINKNYRADHVIVGDAQLVLQQLIAEVKKQVGPTGRPENRQLLETIQRLKTEKSQKYRDAVTSNERPMNPYRVYGDIMQAIDREHSVITHDSGNTRDQLSTIWEATVPHGYVGWGNVSTLGFGLGAALGAKLAYPQRTVVNFCGDAGFGYFVGNLEVGLREKIPVITVHINNSGFSGYGPGFWGPGGHPSTSAVTPSSVFSSAKIAEGVGIYSERVEAPDEVIPAFRRAVQATASGRPALLEMICSQYPITGRWVTG
jgi:thiamine pyrophosphate-dependent acetolactate synthase large subunit-like protein